MMWVIALAIWTTLLVGARLAMSRDLFRVVVGLALITVLIGLFPDTLAAYCLAAAAEIGGAR
jgi:hypothetical protein